MNQTPSKSAENNRLPKMWKIASRHSKYEAKRPTNNALEMKYNAILSEAKRYPGILLSPVFERNYRHNTAESSLLMHAYMTENFYWLLLCDLEGQYQIEFAFNDFPFEKPLRELMLQYPLKDRCRQVKLTPNYEAFFKNVLSYQDKKYISKRPKDSR